jgi:hypothetical protein
MVVYIIVPKKEEKPKNKDSYLEMALCQFSQLEAEKAPQAHGLNCVTSSYTPRETHFK